MTTVENLDVYKRSHQLTLNLYKLTKNFPKEELYGLSSQIKRAAASINANIMEGGARNTNKEYKYFIGVARGPASELLYHMILAKDLELIPQDKSEILIDEIRQITRMLNGLHKSIS